MIRRALLSLAAACLVCRLVFLVAHGARVLAHGIARALIVAAVAALFWTVAEAIARRSRLPPRR